MGCPIEPSPGCSSSSAIGYPNNIHIGIRMCVGSSALTRIYPTDEVCHVGSLPTDVFWTPPLTSKCKFATSIALALAYGVFHIFNYCWDWTGCNNLLLLIDHLISRNLRKTKKNLRTFWLVWQCDTVTPRTICIVRSTISIACYWVQWSSATKMIYFI